MTREELILTLEQYCQKTESDLAVSKQALSLLKGGIYAPEHAKKLRNEPIVYGNGYHDGKKKGPGSHGGARTIKQTTLEARAVIYKLLKSHPEGLGTFEMTQAIRKAGIDISGSTVHNALRKLNPVIKGQRPSPRTGIPAKIYALPESSQ